MDTDVLQQFALDSISLSVLTSLQAELIRNDINMTNALKDSSEDVVQKMMKKREWDSTWRAQVESGFAHMEVTPSPTIWSYGNKEYEEAMKHLRTSSSRLKAGLVLLELSAWEAYWPMTRDQTEELRGLRLYPDVHKQFLEEASVRLGFPMTYGSELRKEITSAQKEISGYRRKLMVGLLVGFGIGALSLGLAAPFIAGAIGAGMGLSGAAAVNAGLAALAGGSIAAGGFGMAGGTAVLVGGGALLGLGLGGAAGGMVGHITAQSVLLSAAKLEVVLKEFILQGQADITRIEGILIAQSRAIQYLQEELIRLQIAGQKTDERVKTLKQSMSILRRALERNLDEVG